MIRGHIKSISQENGCVLISIRAYYPTHPDMPYQYDYPSEEEFEKAKMAFYVKRGEYEKEKREIDLLRLGPVNLFQDDEIKDGEVM